MMLVLADPVQGTAGKNKEWQVETALLGPF
jgi:hypothetical protein